MHALPPLLALLLLACDDKADGTPPTQDDTGVATLIDDDHDGWYATEDCDDANPQINPGVAEACNGIDDDCDGDIDEDGAGGGTSWYADADEDGFGDPAQAVKACEPPPGTTADGSDCDDGDPAIHPLAEEVCNGVDDDCDDTIDEDGAGGTWYQDIDGDGYGDPSTATVSCDTPGAGWVAAGEDCDDADPLTHPGAEETDCADPVDHNCDGSVGDTDLDGDGWTACHECDDGDPEIRPDATEVCDGVDNNCDALTDDEDPKLDSSTGTTWYLDTDGDGYGDPDATTQACETPAGATIDDQDCDDTNAAVNPDGIERCNGIDDDCDGSADGADATDATTWYADADGDGYGEATTTSVACTAPSGTTDDSTDCDDTNASVHPGADETCDGADEDCDGGIDEGAATDAPTWYADADTDGYGDPDSSTAACTVPSGYTSDDSDCDDGDSAVNPGESEICADGLDNDCDGTANGCGTSGPTTLASGDLTLTGLVKNDAAGSTLAFTGDLDGDGLDDLAVGATAYDGADTSTGRLWLVSGAGSGTASLSTAFATIDGSAKDDALTTAVAGLGDLNGDGYDDLVVGTPLDDDSFTDEGAAFLFYGPLSGGFDESDADGTMRGHAAGAWLGGSLGGDRGADRDGLAQLLVGVQRDTTAGSKAGAVWLFDGALSGELGSTDASGILTGVAASDQAGNSVAMAGDADGDGVDDLFVGAWYNSTAAAKAGAAYLVLGPLSGSLGLASADLTLLGESADDQAGYQVAAGADFDGDGLDDLLVGAPGNDGGGSGAGRAYLVLGGQTGSSSLAAADALMSGDAVNDLWGRAVALSHDTNGDGLAEILVGGPQDELTNSAEGVAWLFVSPLSGSLGPSDATASFAGDLTKDYAATAIAADGDANGDGLADILIGAPGVDTGASAAGAAILFLGSGL